jgi:Flp pilus assembly pilin Flp
MKSEKGQGLPEYGLLVALISIVVNLAVIFFGESVGEFFSELGCVAFGICSY